MKSSRTSGTSLAFAAVFACLCHVVAAQDAGNAARYPDSEDRAPAGFVADAQAYVTAPLHWNATDWLYFGGTLAAIAAAHHYDDQVRTHFTTGRYAGNLNSNNKHDVQDALPALAAVGATWVYASLIRDSSGHREAAEMVEAGILGSASALVLKFAIRREGPDQTADSRSFGGGGTSFPSLHASAAFAVGTVLAESGSDDVRWIRRLLGYGIGAATAYERLKHNAHWLSDTVAGAGLGIATAHFVMNRHPRPGYASNVMVVPIDGGAMLTFSATLAP